MRFQFTVNVMQTIACKCWLQDAAFFLTRRRPRSKMLQVPSKNNFSSKMLPIARECEILGPKWSKLHILVPKEQITRKSVPNWKTKQIKKIAPKNKCLTLVCGARSPEHLFYSNFLHRTVFTMWSKGLWPSGNTRNTIKTNYGFILSASYCLFILFQLSH